MTSRHQPNSTSPQDPGARTARAFTPVLLFLACVLAQAACNDGGEHWSQGPGLSEQGGPGGAQSTPQPGPPDMKCPDYASTPSPFPAQDLASPFPTAAAGTIPGAFSVTSTGEANYHMVLATPPGR